MPSSRFRSVVLNVSSSGEQQVRCAPSLACRASQRCVRALARSLAAALLARANRTHTQRPLPLIFSRSKAHTSGFRAPLCATVCACVRRRSVIGHCRLLATVWPNWISPAHLLARARALERRMRLDVFVIGRTHRRHKPPIRSIIGAAEPNNGPLRRPFVSRLLNNGQHGRDDESRRCEYDLPQIGGLRARTQSPRAWPRPHQAAPPAHASGAQRPI